MSKNSPYIWSGRKRTLFGLPISFTRYFLTDKKLVTRRGFFSINEDEVELYKITDKSLSLPFGQRLFGCGTIIINCKDIDTPRKELKSIKKPRIVMALIEEQVDIQRDKYRIRGRDIIGSYDDGSDSHEGCHH